MQVIRIWNDKIPRLARRASAKDAERATTCRSAGSAAGDPVPFQNRPEDEAARRRAPATDAAPSKGALAYSSNSSASLSLLVPPRFSPPQLVHPTQQQPVPSWPLPIAPRPLPATAPYQPPNSSP